MRVVLQQRLDRRVVRGGAVGRHLDAFGVQLAADVLARARLSSSQRLGLAEALAAAGPLEFPRLLEAGIRGLRFPFARAPEKDTAAGHPWFGVPSNRGNRLIVRRFATRGDRPLLLLFS